MCDPKDGDIWQIDLTDSRGHEQGNERPAIFIRCSKNLGLHTVVPLTSKKNIFRYSHTHEIGKSNTCGLEKDSVAMIFQLLTISSDRLIRKRGCVSNGDFAIVKALIVDYLKLSQI
ncbi:MAG: type II toxin-antitoxin system PemK/MazF family toxin [Methanomicrobiales archaeon]|jgi:mRNA-degrading endonuclease toxin of MazEF toxin-antitoxin module|nr:type II toxin-antitoxin system PemK/MazF family toxin [Methanomicrobiales archaeon]